MTTKDSICGIYGIYDTENNTCLYVGQSKDIKSRFKAHKQCLRNGTHIPGFVEYYNQKERKEDIQYFILEETDNIPLVKNIAEIKWFNFKHPLFYRYIPSINSKYFTISEEEREKRSKKQKEIYEKIKKLCIQCKHNKTISKDSICEKCRRKNNVLLARQNAEYNRENNIVYSDEDIIKMYQDGMSSTEIGIIVGKYAAYITKVLRRNNVEVRGHGALSKTRKNGFQQSPKEIKCPNCNNNFIPKRKNAKYCSRKCSSESMLKPDKKRNNNIMDIKNKYMLILDEKFNEQKMGGHIRWHYEEKGFSPVCDYCLIDYPNINVDNISWMSIKEIEDKHSLDKDELRNFLKKSGLLVNKSKAGNEAQDPKNLYCYWYKGRIFKWNEEKVLSLYNSS